jgi:hypothetical protein
MLDEEEIEYEEDSEDLSEVDDDDLMKRLEAKYGKISGENSEDEEDPDGSWTSNYDTLTTHHNNLIPFSLNHVVPRFASNPIFTIF